MSSPPARARTCARTWRRSSRWSSEARWPPRRFRRAPAPISAISRFAPPTTCSSWSRSAVGRSATSPSCSGSRRPTSTRAHATRPRRTARHAASSRRRPASASTSCPTAVASSCWCGSRGRAAASSRAWGLASRRLPRTAPSAPCATSSCSPARWRSSPRWPAASRSPRGWLRRCAAWRAWPRAWTAGSSPRGWRSATARTRCACWPRRSITCSTACRTRSIARRPSSPTRRTSCARR